MKERRVVKALKMRGAVLFVLASLALCGCGGVPRAAPPLKETPARPNGVAAAPTPAPTPSAEMSVDEFFSQRPLPPGYDKAELLKAWAREPGRERYRLTRPEDFVFGEEARRARGRQVTETERGSNVVWGEFNGNYGANFVVLVTDRTKEGPDRFGVVLFKERDAGGYDVHWIYRDADFSHGLTVNRHSGNIYLDKFAADGSETGCDIGWSRAERKFTCHDF